MVDRRPERHGRGDGRRRGAARTGSAHRATRLPRRPFDTDHPENPLGDHMTAEQSSRPGPGVRGMRRKAIDTTRLVDTRFLEGREDALPLVFAPAVDNVDLAEWAASHRDEIEAGLDR